jgi:hypothetical protein
MWPTCEDKARFAPACPPSRGARQVGRLDTPATSRHRRASASATGVVSAPRKTRRRSRGKLGSANSKRQVAEQRHAGDESGHNRGTRPAAKEPVQPCQAGDLIQRLAKDAIDARYALQLQPRASVQCVAHEVVPAKLLPGQRAACRGERMVRSTHHAEPVTHQRLEGQVWVFRGAADQPEIGRTR